MKRMAALVLTLVLLLTSLAIPAMADAQDLSAVITWYQSVKNGSAKKLAGDPVYVPKLVVAVFDEGDEPTECSLNYGGGEEDGFHGIPDAWLAASMSEAKSIVLIFRESIKVGTYSLGGDALRTKTRVAVVDLTDKGVYELVTAADNDPPSRTTKHNGDAGAYEPEEGLDLVAEKLKSLNPAGSKARYDEAKKLYKAKKFYSASIAFGESLYKDWRKQRKSCVQKWPKNKEIYHNKSVKGSNAQLQVQVNKQDKNTATVVRIYKGDKLASILFIGGNGKATAKLPAGTYTVKTAKGSTWYGTNELFGKYGSYQTLLFNEGTSRTTSLQKGYRRTITINVVKDDPNASGVGSEEESYEDATR